MSKIPVLSSKEVIKALGAAGFEDAPPTSHTVPCPRSNHLLSAKSFNPSVMKTASVKLTADRLISAYKWLHIFTNVPYRTTSKGFDL